MDEARLLLLAVPAKLVLLPSGSIEASPPPKSDLSPAPRPRRLLLLVLLLLLMVLWLLLLLLMLPLIELLLLAIEFVCVLETLLSLFP